MTWVLTQVSRAIREHSNHYTNDPVFTYDEINTLISCSLGLSLAANKLIRVELIYSFNDISTLMRLFYARKLVNCLCIVYLYLQFLCSFFNVLYTQLYNTKYSYMIIICKLNYLAYRWVHNLLYHSETDWTGELWE